MRGMALNLKYKICYWLFILGFLREVIAIYDNGGIKNVYAIGFSPRRRWRETVGGQK